MKSLPKVTIKIVTTVSENSDPFPDFYYDEFRGFVHGILSVTQDNEEIDEIKKKIERNLSKSPLLKIIGDFEVISNISSCATKIDDVKEIVIILKQNNSFLGNPLT